MRLQLTSLALVAIACAPPNAGITFDEPDSGPWAGSTSSGAPGSSSTAVDPPSTLTDGEAESAPEPMTTSGHFESETSSGTTDATDDTTGTPLPDPVTQIEWTFGTASYAGHFAPKNIAAAWIEDDQGNFVRTLMMVSQIEKIHLVEWNLVSAGNTVDAITGATPLDHTTLHSGVWDLHDASGQLVPDGDYVLRMEMTEDNSAGLPPEGPLRAIAFTLGNGHFDIMPPASDSFHTLRVYGHD